MSDSRKSLKYKGLLLNGSDRFIRDRDPTTADYRCPETNNYYELCSFWLNSTTQSPFILVSIAGNSATWVAFSGGLGDVISLTGDDTDIVKPDVAGDIQIHGTTVANATNTQPVWTEGTIASNLIEVQVQVAADITGAAGNANDAGIASFNDSQFVVDADGYTSLIGSNNPAIQTITGDDTEVVTPDANGNVDWQGATVANATNAQPLYINGTPGSNLVSPEIQVGTKLATAPADYNDAGLLSVDSGQFDVTSYGFASILDRVLIQDYANIGITYSSSTFTVLAADGNAMSASNPGYVKISNPTSLSLSDIYRVTSNFSFEDATGTSDIVDNLFGLTTTDVWGTDMPFFLYMVLAADGTTVVPFIARTPTYIRTPTNVSNLSQKGSTTATTQQAIFLLNSGLTLSNYTTRPCTCIGSFKMTKDASDDWTITSLSLDDGVGKFQEGKKFIVPTGVFGSASTSYFKDNGGTAPTVSSSANAYFINRDGLLRINFTAFLSSTGVGAVSAQAVVPFQLTLGAAASVVYNYGIGYVVAPANFYPFFVTSPAGGATYVYFQRFADTIPVTTVLNTDCVSGQQLCFDITTNLGNMFPPLAS